MEILNITSGVKIYRDDKISIMFGCPPEIIKFLMLQKIDFPDCIILPDKVYHNGILQNCTEFPLYYFLFILGNFFKGKKLQIGGDKAQVEANRELLRLTLLGPTIEEFKEIKPDIDYKLLYQEARALSLKDKNGKEIPIDGLVNFMSFKDNIIQNPDYTIEHVDYNVYKINNNIIDINFNDEQLPPYDLKFDYVPMIANKLGIDIMGGGSGFTPNRPCSGMILNYNSDYMLLDCVPYLDYHLNARGIAKQQIKSIFLTHIHDDHCNIFPLVFFNQKIKFLGTKEIYWMALKKLSLMTLHDMEEFYSYFDFIELKPYEKNDFYGISVTPHYTVHSIPTIGATFRMKENRNEYSIAFVGDNKALPEIKKMTDQGIVAKDKYNYLKKMYTERHNLLFPDGGMGILHGDPKDSLKSKSDRVIFLHLEQLPKEFDTTFSTARAGKRYGIHSSYETSYIIKTMRILNNTYPGISEEWLTALMSNLNIVQYNAGDVIMKQGEDRRPIIYIILAGAASVMFHNGKSLSELAVKEAGDFIGEMAIVRREKKRSASIVAKTPVILCTVEEDLYYSFLVDENRIDAIKTMWQIRSELESNFPFTNFSDVVNEKIAKVGRRFEAKKGTVIIKQGTINKEFYIILKGSCKVLRDNKEVTTLKNGNFFGEFGSLSENMRNATVKTDKDTVFLEISNDQIKKIITSTPSLHFYVNQIMKERAENISNER